MLVVDQGDITEMWTKARGTDVFDVPDDKMFAFLDRNAVLGLTPGTLFSHVDKVVYAELFELTKGRVLEHEKFVEQLAKWLKGKERDWVSSDVEAAAWRLRFKQQVVDGFTYFPEMSLIAAPAPVLNDKMIVIKEPYTSLIMDGIKTMELRCRPITGEYFLADSTTHTVKAKLVFGASRELSQEDYENTRHLHCVGNPTKRYKKTVGTFITSVQPLVEEPSYQALRGQNGFARFMPPDLYSDYLENREHCCLLDDLE